jgi:hypothetical protein
MVPMLPGTTGTPASRMRALARALSPMRAIVSGEGPMKTIPAAWQISAKCA